MIAFFRDLPPPGPLQYAPLFVFSSFFWQSSEVIVDYSSSLVVDLRRLLFFDRPPGGVGHQPSRFTLSAKAIVTDISLPRLAQPFSSSPPLPLFPPPPFHGLPDSRVQRFVMIAPPLTCLVSPQSHYSWCPCTFLFLNDDCEGDLCVRPLRPLAYFDRN